jgi:hypothetical protein
MQGLTTVINTLAVQTPPIINTELDARHIIVKKVQYNGTEFRKDAVIIGTVAPSHKVIVFISASKVIDVTFIDDSATNTEEIMLTASGYMSMNSSQMNDQNITALAEKSHEKHYSTGYFIIDAIDPCGGDIVVGLETNGKVTSDAKIRLYRLACNSGARMLQNVARALNIADSSRASE